jgi:hypothetical protein
MPCHRPHGTAVLLLQMQAPGALTAVMSPSGSAGGYQGSGRRSSKTQDGLPLQQEPRRNTQELGAYR